MIYGRLPVVLMAGLVAVGGAPAAAQTGEELVESGHVRIRHRLEPAKPVYVGQPVRVWVEVMTRTWFLEAPRYPSTIEVRKAIVIPPEAFAVNSSERIGSDTYAVQSRAFTVFPQTTGRFEIPPIRVELVVARDDASRSPEIVLQTELLTIEARLPAGAEGHGPVLATPSLSIEERYSRSTDGLKVGESFKRRVTMRIDDSVAMLLPPMPFEAPVGIAVYPARPEVEDQRNRGQLAGTRVDEATYLMEAEGTYELPEVNLWWWNLRTSSLEQETLPGVQLTVDANPELATEHLGLPESEEELAEGAIVKEELEWGLKQWASVLGILAIGALVLRQALAWSRQQRRVRDALQGESEKVFFQRFESAARSNDPQATYQALLRWLDRFEPVHPPASGRQFVAMAGDEKLSAEYDALEGRLFGGREQADRVTWNGRSLATAVRRARQHLEEHRPASYPREEALPQLNPGPDG